MDLRALEANYQPIDLGYGKPKQPQKKKKNFLLDQISTAGGIGGGILGSFVTPIAGTAAGAGIGSALGETLENALMGESLTKNVAKEGALGAVFGAGPIKLLKGGATLAAGKGLQAASQAAMTPLRRKAGQALVNASDDLVIKQFRFTPTQLTNFKNKFGEDAAQVVKKYGFQNADDISTKGIEPLQQQFDDAIGGIAGVPKESLKKNLMKRIESLSKAGPSDSKALGKNLKAEANALLKGRPDVIDAKELNTIRRQFDNLVTYNEKAANPARYGVNKRVADSIRETLQQADPTGSLKNVGRELSKLRQLSDVAKRQGNLGRGNLPIGLINSLGATAGSAAGGVPGLIGTAAGTVAVNSPTGRKLLAGATEKTGKKLLTQGTTKQTVKGIASRLGVAGGLEAALQQGQSLENSEMNPNTTMPSTKNPSISNTLQQYQTEAEMSSPYSRDNLITDITRDPENAEEYFKLFQMYDEVFNPKGQREKPLNQTQQERSDLMNALSLTEGAVNAGSINFGPVGSRIEGVKSMFNAADPETLAYKNTVSGLRAAITKARAGASLTPGELKMLAQYTPSDTDSEQVVRSKLAQLRALYGSTPPRGGGSLEDALMSLQGAY